jgi:hypothetical protein
MFESDVQGAQGDHSPHSEQTIQSHVHSVLKPAVMGEKRTAGLGATPARAGLLPISWEQLRSWQPQQPKGFV